MLAHKKYELKTLMCGYIFVITNCNTTFGIQNIKLIEHILALYQKVFGQSNGMKHNCRAIYDQNKICTVPTQVSHTVDISLRNIIIN